MPTEFLARRYDTAQFARIRLDGDRVVSATALADDEATRVNAAAKSAGPLPWVSPGFVDVQVNGWGGQEFSSEEITPEQVAQITREHFPFGVTSYCPTLTTHSYACLAHGLAAIHQACETIPEVAAYVPGIHLEGPFFSTEDGPRGAHPKEHCQRPDWNAFCRLQDAAGGRIRILTMSVEFDESAEFVAKVTASGVCVSIGHTGADSAHIRAAVDAGARMSTHLGNGAHRMLRRHPNYIWDQLAEDRLTASLIIDGHHLPPEVVKSMVRAKTPERIVLVSDVSGLAGKPVGRYAMTSGLELEILPDGRLVIAGQDQLLAGASLPIQYGIANVMRFAGVDLPTAVAMASTTPARIIDAPCGGLRPGDLADLALFHWSPGDTTLEIAATISHGKVVYGKLSTAV
ncbi:MAG: N-acetylglucosamine-6-phosphate deacetylase [Planctomycetales bacterium]|nr:N-acetylglucosamine-6-phosphate deacetylase [Planctomycetales bacterium]